MRPSSWGAHSYDVHIEGEGVGQEINQLCGCSVQLDPGGLAQGFVDLDLESSPAGGPLL